MANRTVPRARIAALHTYPVKGCRGVTHTAQALTLPVSLGIDTGCSCPTPAASSRSANARGWRASTPRSAAWRAESCALEGIRNCAAPCTPTGSRREVTVWRDRCLAQVSVVDTRDWLESVTGMRGQLVRSLPGDERTSAKEFAGEALAPVRFADAFALLLTNETSLEDLNSRLDRPLPMARFRPNLVLQGLRALRRR